MLWGDWNHELIPNERERLQPYWRIKKLVHNLTCFINQLHQNNDFHITYRVFGECGGCMEHLWYFFGYCSSSNYPKYLGQMAIENWLNLRKNLPLTILTLSTGPIIFLMALLTVIQVQCPEIEMKVCLYNGLGLCSPSSLVSRCGMWWVPGGPQSWSPEWRESRCVRRWAMEKPPEPSNWVSTIITCLKKKNACQSEKWKI